MNDQEVSEEDIFKVACEITSKAARDVYLQQICGKDDALRERLMALLRADEEQAATLDRPAVPPPVTIDAPSDQRATIESVIGPYKILQEIGEGGMGVVYMAEQTKPVKRRIALKIIKPGMDSAQVVARFEAERQALAMMDHPNIAKVLDAGATESGRPYFVMELVKGIPITQYCDENRLNTKQRLELFSLVCRGVQHAHQKGIIHRDLKPTNVLVAEYDHKPVPKIIDFGVAKATSQELTEKTLFTQFGQIVGTLDYMSPEQAKFNQLDIDTRSDIYSLGVLLYALLTGSTPIEGERLRTSALDEVLRIIREEDAPRPSTRLSSSDTLPAIAANRNSDPRVLTGQLREDLDWIVMKALAKERNERYQTAEAFAADIDRHLDDRPIEARRPSMLGRTRRFVRRHRTTVAIATMAVCTILLAASLGAVAYLGTLKQAKQEAALAETRADAERARLETERKRVAREVSLPQVKSLVDERRVFQAFQIAGQLRDLLAGDPEFEQVWQRLSVTVTLDVKPDGTTVWYRDARSVDDDWTVLGLSPLIDVELPKCDLRFRYTKEGHLAREFQRKFPEFLSWDGSAGSLMMDDGNDDGMVLVTASAASWNGIGMDIDAFRIDQYEVSNREFQQFVDSGGYENPDYWSDVEFVRDGELLSWEQAMEVFVDATGLSGPATWRDGRFSSGQDDYPVGGVSWYEAVAYAKFREKSLPTVHHWRWAANSDQSGIVTALSNFSDRGPTRRGTHAGIGRFEVYDMAGNVKEWCWNEDHQGRRSLRGGAWSDSEYRFTDSDAASPWDRKPTNGFRCVRYLADDSPTPASLKVLPNPARILVDLPRESFESLRAWYQYDHLPLNAVQLPTDEASLSGDFRHELIRIDAAYVDGQLDIHLFLPQAKQERYETVVWVSGSGQWNSGGEFKPGVYSDWKYIAELPKSGRIVCHPIYKGTFQRWGGRNLDEQFEESPLKARDDFVAVTKEVSRAVDYLLTRPDVDANRLVYFGQSLGSARGPATLATEPRFNAAVLLAGGYHHAFHEYPEIDPYQFTPHVKTPVLMINGAGDNIMEYESSQIPFYEDLGSKTKKHVRLSAGHNPPADDVHREMTTWLDQVYKDKTAAR